MERRDFETLAGEPRPELDEYALALAAELRPVDREAALAELDRLGSELAFSTGSSPADEAAALQALLGEREGFTGNREDYDDPDNSMLDLVLERRTGLPILLSVVYVEVGRRAGIELAGVGLPGHFVVGHFGATPPLVLDPFTGGRAVRGETRELRNEAAVGGLSRDGRGGRSRPVTIRAWRSHEIALRMLNNLVRSYTVRGDLGRAIQAAELRCVLPLNAAAQASLDAGLRALRARLN